MSLKPNPINLKSKTKFPIMKKRLNEALKDTQNLNGSVGDDIPGQHTV